MKNCTNSRHKLCTNCTNLIAGTRHKLPCHVMQGKFVHAFGLHKVHKLESHLRIRNDAHALCRMLTFMPTQGRAKNPGLKVCALNSIIEPILNTGCAAGITATATDPRQHAPLRRLPALGPVGRSQAVVARQHGTLLGHSQRQSTVVPWLINQFRSLVRSFTERLHLNFPRVGASIGWMYVDA